MVRYRTAKAAQQHIARLGRRQWDSGEPVTGQLLQVKIGALLVPVSVVVHGRQRDPCKVIGVAQQGIAVGMAMHEGASQ